MSKLTIVKIFQIRKTIKLVKPHAIKLSKIKLVKGTGLCYEN
jgi:hypothetical protein